jgi:hypothetical protein
MTEEEMLQLALLRGGNFKDTMGSAMGAQNAALQAAFQRPDTTGLVNLGRERDAIGSGQRIRGIMYAGAPKEYQPLSQPNYTAGLAKEDPWQVGEGWYSGGKYTEDPFKRQSGLVKAMQAQGKQGGDFAESYSKEETGKAQRASAYAQAAKARQEMELGKIGTVKDADGNERLYRVKSDGSVEYLDSAGTGGTAPGGVVDPNAPGRFPEKASNKASEDERRTAYQTQGIASRIPTAYAPGVAEPGFMESAARTGLPGEMGEAVANFLSSASRQQARQSQEGIVDALLYLATGAAYNKEQLTQARREYLAGYTDKPETVAQKRAKLASLAEAARNRAGRAWTRNQELQLRDAFPEIGQQGGAVGASRLPAAKASQYGYTP